MTALKVDDKVMEAIHTANNAVAFTSNIRQLVAEHVSKALEEAVTLKVASAEYAAQLANEEAAALRDAAASAKKTVSGSAAADKQ